jgi:hypothetical protein
MKILFDPLVKILQNRGKILLGRSAGLKRFEMPSKAILTFYIFF